MIVAINSPIKIKRQALYQNLTNETLDKSEQMFYNQSTVEHALIATENSPERKKNLEDVRSIVSRLVK